MKRALIISYNYPPCTVVGGWRVFSWAENFEKYGIEPVVVSRHWTGNERDNHDYYAEVLNEKVVKKRGAITEIYLPFFKSPLAKKIKTVYANKPLIRKLISFWFYLIGTFDPEIDLYYSFKEQLHDIIINNKFDVIIVSSSPLNIIKLGNVLHKKYNIPWIADFRDHYIYNSLNIHYKARNVEKMHNFFYHFYISRWVKTALFCTTVSENIAKKLSADLNKNFEIIRNGYNKKMVDSIQSFQKNKDVFLISHVGTILESLDITIFIKGLTLFLKDKDISKIKINFIGGNLVQIKKDNLIEGIPEQILNITNRVKAEEAIRITKESHVLLLVGSSNFRGVYATKIFDYIASETMILLAPSDKDVQEKLIKETQSGIIANTPEQVQLALSKLYSEWELNGKISYTGIQQEILKYSREIQTENFASLIRYNIL
jgi:hypothetical protein